MTAPLIWVFDVDATLVDSLTGVSLRPGTASLLRDLHAGGHRLILWSAGGAGYAADRLDAHGLAGLFEGWYDKEGRDRDGRYLTPFLESLDRVIFVDDRPEDLPLGAEFIGLRPYLGPNPHDQGLDRVRAHPRFPRRPPVL